MATRARLTNWCCRRAGILSGQATHGHISSRSVRRVGNAHCLRARSPKTHERIPHVARNINVLDPTGPPWDHSPTRVPCLAHALELRANGINLTHRIRDLLFRAVNLVLSNPVGKHAVEEDVRELKAAT